jgi:hypothetical protein
MSPGIEDAGQRPNADVDVRKIFGGVDGGGDDCLIGGVDIVAGISWNAKFCEIPSFTLTNGAALK